MAYDDGEDYNPWDDFLEFKWRDFLDWTRIYKIDRIRITFGQLNRLLSKIGELAEGSNTPSEHIKLIQLEELLKTEQLENLSLKAVLSIVELYNDYGQVTQRFKQGIQQRENIINSIPLDKLETIVGKQIGCIELSDVVALASFSRSHVGEGRDVLEQINIGEISKSISKSALNFLSMNDIRKVLEQLARV